MKVDNIFALIGNDENALTKSLAFQCTQKKEIILKSVLSLFGIKRLSTNSLHNVKVEVQVQEGKKGITDIEFELDDKFIIILEAKIGLSTTPTDWEEQLQRYNNILREKKYPIKKLIFVSDTIQTDKKNFNEITEGIEHQWISWIDIYKKLNKIKKMDETTIDRQFMQFFKEMLMEKEIVIVPIGNAKGKLNVSVEWKIIEDQHFYRYPSKPREALYIAFFIKGVGIEKMAKLKLPYKTTTWGEISKIMLKYYPNHEWYTNTSNQERGYLLEFKDIFNLPHLIPSGGYGPQNPIYCTFKELLTAESVKKLHY